MSKSKPSTWMIALFVLFLLLIIVALVGISATTGNADITVDDAYSAILHKFFPNSYAPSWLAEVCVWNLRLPRIIMGILAGICLGLAGATMQWVLKNPFASPYTLGISHTAVFGTYVAMIIGGASIGGGAFMILGTAGIFALIAAAIVLHISRRRWATPERVVLMGIVMVILSSAITTILMYFSGARAVKESVFWMVGDLSRSSLDVLAYMAGTIVLCAIPLLLLIFIPSLFGVDERRIRTYAMFVASLLVAITVYFTGTIGFIGLLAPHICRLVIGNDHRFVIPISGLVGAVLLIGSDLVARTVISPVILPVDVLTTLMGAPLLAYLIVREGRRAVRSA
ncbi:MAG: iron ABC transporter permease [Methanosarcinales archaeon]|nr:iron ABC transporter permease [Methanosarcinales archaeon]